MANAISCLLQKRTSLQKTSPVLLSLFKKFSRFPRFLQKVDIFSTHCFASTGIMQFQVSKKTLQQQVRPPIREKKLKNQDRILYVKGLFNPPPTETSESVMGTKVLDQWRNVLSLGVLTAFLMLMMMVSIIGDYGILSSHQLQERKEILEQNIKDLKNKEMLMREEIHALKNSPTFIAVVARRELGWVKENERVYFFNQEKKSL